MTDRPTMAARFAADYDPLSLILDGIRLGGATCFSLQCKGSWACQTPAPHEHPNAKIFENQQAVLFHVISKGSGRCLAFGSDIPVSVGDLLIFPFGDPHVLSGGDQLVEPVHVLQALPSFPWPPTPRFSLGKGEDTLRFICGVLYFEGLAFNPLFADLPRVIHIRPEQQKGSQWLSSSLQMIVSEFEEPDAGGISMSKRLAEVLFVSLLRRLLSDAPQDRTGWLAALSDPRVGEALAHIHQDPARQWSIATLAKASGTSRSRLAEDFKFMIGMGPMEYLLRWRMELARRSLKDAEMSVAQIAYETGYGSEPAFSRAFKRIFGVAPGRLRKSSSVQAKAA
jgi:AraC-like DNA-binding protein